MDQFQNTLSAAVNAPAPALGNPLGASEAGLLQNAMGSSFKLGGSTGALNALSGDQADKVQNQQNADAVARAQQLQDLQTKQQQAADAMNGKNFQIIPTKDGGQSYKDPLGNNITLNQYVQATGQSPDKVLANSGNKLDQQFVQDYGNLNALHTALVNNDQKALQNLGIKLYGDNSKKATDPVNVAAIAKIGQFRQVSPQQLVQAFVQHYPNVFTNQNSNSYGSGNSQVVGGGGYVSGQGIL
jgi:hypothetical protein